jgi:hypothetical protein
MEPSRAFRAMAQSGAAVPRGETARIPPGRETRRLHAGYQGGRQRIRKVRRPRASVEGKNSAVVSELHWNA